MNLFRSFVGAIALSTGVLTGARSPVLAANAPSPRLLHPLKLLPRVLHHRFPVCRQRPSPFLRKRQRLPRWKLPTRQQTFSMRQMPSVPIGCRVEVKTDATDARSLPSCLFLAYRCSTVNAAFSFFSPRVGLHAIRALISWESLLSSLPPTAEFLPQRPRRGSSLCAFAGAGARSFPAL